MQMFSANGIVEVTPTLSVSGVTYYRHFRQSHIDGNISEFDECDGAWRRASRVSAREDGAPLFDA